MPLVLLLLAFSGKLAADSEDERLLAGLRERRLFQLAESFSLDRLADAGLSAAQRAPLVIELIRTYAAHAVNSPPQERGALWEKAHTAAADFARQYPDDPRQVLVRVQDALTVLARGELLRQEAEIGAGPADALELAKEQVRRAAAQLRAIDQELTKEIPLRSRGRPADGQLTAFELTSLQHNVQHQLARAFRNQALCYAKGSDDRIASLSRALGQLAKPPAQMAPGDPLLWQIYVDQVVCLRLLEDFDKAATTLAALETAAAPAAVKLRVRAEKARIAAARGRLAEALAVFEQGRTIDGKTSAELDFALLEVYLAQWSAAAAKKDEQAAGKSQKLAVAVVDLLEQQHGAYWSRRGELLLVRSAARSGGTRDLEILSRTADNLYLQKQFDEAIAAYDQAARQAAAAANKQAAFDLAFKAAAVVYQLSRHEDAARRMGALAVGQPQNSQASRAHWLGVLSARAQLAAASKAASGTDPQTADNGDLKELTTYVDMLEEHLEIWPTAPTADDGHFALGLIRGYRRAWPLAIKAYLSVSPASKSYAEAVAKAAECSRLWFDELKAAGQPYDQAAKQAVDYFERLVYDADRKLPERWDNVARMAAVTAARIRLQHMRDGYRAAGELLEAAVDASPDAPAEWKSAATSLLVVALAGQATRRSEALARLRQLADGDPQELLEMLVGLAALADAARADVRGQMATLLLEAVEILAAKQDQLSDQGRFSLARIRAEALAAAGKRSAAQQAYAELAKQHPHVAQVQRGYALFLSSLGDKSSLERALGQWRSVASKTRPQTDGWYEAKFSVAQTLYRLGRKEPAAQLIRYLQATPPGLKETRWAAPLRELLVQCQR